MLDTEFAETTKPVPPILYHYTTPKAALSIIETGELWATHAWYVNDSTELEFGLEVYSRMIEKLAKMDHHTRFREFLESHTIVKVLMRYSTVFVCCFSGAENQLSQWRAYSGLGRTTGYSLGFDAAGLRKITFRNSPLLFMKVSYEQDEHEKIVQDVLTAIDVHLEKLDEEIMNEDWYELLSFITQWLQIVLIGLKRSDFHEEKEWRLVYRTFGIAEPAELNYRVSESGVMIPYCTLRAPGVLPLTEVTVGPTVEPSIATFSLEQLLKKHNYPSVAVRHSDIPLRAL